MQVHLQIFSIMFHLSTYHFNLYIDCHGIGKKKKGCGEYEEACKSVKNGGLGPWEASRKYNVPIETLRR